EAEQLLGSAVKHPGDPGYLQQPDLREPLFYELEGRLHLLFMQIAGVSMRFEPLRAWHTELNQGKWSALEPALAPGEHFWDAQVRSEVAGRTAYLSLARGGGHYAFASAKQPTGVIDLRRSRDGREWQSVSDTGAVDQ